MTKPNPRIVEPQDDDDRGMEMLAYAVIYASIILALCIVAMLYAGAVGALLIFGRLTILRNRGSGRDDRLRR
ncbi:MAG: hypothetical protein IPM06_17890 [Rhizobiales bacterium]|nr:hypothetical protein [Hyphomicrobiales bacterium]